MSKNRGWILSALLLLAVAFCFPAGAAPALTDGETDGWIGENSYLYMRCSDGALRRMETSIADLLAMTDTELVCQTPAGQVYGIRKDGTSSRVVPSAEAETLREQAIAVREGKLTVNGSVLSSQTMAAADDGRYVYYVEKVSGQPILRVATLPDGSGSGSAAASGTRDAQALALNGRQVSAALNLTVTKEALTLTGTDHQLTVVNLETGAITVYGALSNQTEAACVEDGQLYRYRKDDQQAWIPESGDASLISMPPAAATPTVTVSAVTATPTPTATPTATATATPTEDDGSLHRGDSGDEVRKVQKRLAELGYPTGKVDGVYGEQTQTAINLFCNAIHVRERKYIPKSVQTKLFASNAPAYDPFLPLKRGDEGTSVRYMQVRLKELGYDPGEIDGVYGSQTVDAVARYQFEHGVRMAEGERAGEYASHEMLENLYAPGPEPEAPFYEGGHDVINPDDYRHENKEHEQVLDF